jgi:hypothetical protein
MQAQRTASEGDGQTQGGAVNVTETRERVGTVASVGRAALAVAGVLALVAVFAGDLRFFDITRFMSALGALSLIGLSALGSIRPRRALATAAGLATGEPAADPRVPEVLDRLRPRGTAVARPVAAASGVRGSAGPAAGWYPQEDETLRRWDGARWTDDVRPATGTPV